MCCHQEYLSVSQRLETLPLILGLGGYGPPTGWEEMLAAHSEEGGTSFKADVSIARNLARLRNSSRFWEARQSHVSEYKERNVLVCGRLSLGLDILQREKARSLGGCLGQP